jgi:hypothetical protein
MTGHARLVSWPSPTMDGDLGQASELAREIFDVGACSTVDLWRIFTCEQRNLPPVRHDARLPICTRRLLGCGPHDQLSWSFESGVRLERVQLVLDFVPSGFLLRFRQSRQHLLQGAKRFTFKTDTLRRGGES